VLRASPGINNLSKVRTTRKSHRVTDEEGNYLFEVEASNENVDLQKQIVLQSALLESKDSFLRRGKINFNHMHKRRGPDGQTISDPSMIIGEPIEVRTEGNKTFVKGKLYNTSKMAQELVRHLQAGSTRIKASVQGFHPKIVPNIRTGIETVVSLDWNGLAFTVNPVNPTLSPVRLLGIKSKGI